MARRVKFLIDECLSRHVAVLLRGKHKPIFAPHMDTGDFVVVVNAAKVVTDGPFIEVKEIVGGFSIVQAGTLDAAAELAKGCPIFQRGGSVEVRPLQGFTMGK